MIVSSGYWEHGTSIRSNTLPNQIRHLPADLRAVPEFEAAAAASASPSAGSCFGVSVHPGATAGPNRMSGGGARKPTPPPVQVLFWRSAG